VCAKPKEPTCQNKLIRLHNVAEWNPDYVKNDIPMSLSNKIDQSEQW